MTPFIVRFQWMLNRTNLNSLEPKNGEVVELMFPSGSLLRVLRLSESGNYTCCVRNEAGRRCSSSFVRLISGTSSPCWFYGLHLSLPVYWQTLRCPAAVVRSMSNIRLFILLRICWYTYKYEVWRGKNV